MDDRGRGDAWRRDVVWGAVVLVVGAGGAWWAWDASQDRAATAAEPTAWQARQDMTRLIEETAEVLGLETTPRPAGEQELVCPRARGGEGVSFHVPGFNGPVVDDVEALLAQVREFWEGRGLTVRGTGLGEAKGLIGTDELGSVATLLSGPGGTFAEGDTFCATVSGRPEA